MILYLSCPDNPSSSLSRLSLLLAFASAYRGSRRSWLNALLSLPALPLRHDQPLKAINSKRGRQNILDRRELFPLW